MFLLKIDKFVNEDMKCFCVKNHKSNDEIIITGNLAECLAFVSGFAFAYYHQPDEIACITKDAENLRKEIYL